MILKKVKWDYDQMEQGSLHFTRTGHAHIFSQFSSNFAQLP